MRRRFFATLVVALGLAGSARAGLVITVPNAKIVANGTAILDVTIQGDITDPAQKLAMADYDFVITPITGQPASLQFSEAQPDQFDGPRDYVFPLGDPSDYRVIDYEGVNDLLFNSDDNFNSATDRYENVSLTSPRILFRLRVTTELLPVAVGDTFKVELLRVRYEGEDIEIAVTRFQQAFDDGTLDPTPIFYDSRPGVVTVVASAVPEPGSLTLLATGGGALVVWLRRRRAA